MNDRSEPTNVTALRIYGKMLHFVIVKLRHEIRFGFGQHLLSTLERPRFSGNSDKRQSMQYEQQ